MTDSRELTFEEWNVEGTKRFGKNKLDWKFQCPSCGYVASVNDYKSAGAPEGAVGYSCIGRYGKFDRVGQMLTGQAPCNYAGGGFIPINPWLVTDMDGKKHQLFAFADAV